MGVAVAGGRKKVDEALDEGAVGALGHVDFEVALALFNYIILVDTMFGFSFQLLTFRMILIRFQFQVKASLLSTTPVSRIMSSPSLVTS